jgi:phospholipase C
MEPKGKGNEMVADDRIKHIVLLMMENHSFDQMLGCLQGIYPDLDGVDIDAAEPRYNLDSAGNKVFQSPTDVQQVPHDPTHENRFVLEQIANRNSGFITEFEKSVPGSTAQDRQSVMGYYLLDRLPALHQLGRNFTVCDRWFSSLPGPTWPNRFFALSGTSSGRVLMPEGPLHVRPLEVFVQNQVTVFDRLSEVGKSWRIYYYDFPSSLLLTRQREPENLAGYSLINNFFSDVRDERKFPSFVFIEPKYFGADQNDDHPPHNIFKAQKLIADVYNAIRSNAELWDSTLLVVAYDEHGGFYDHVPPPAAVPPDERREEWSFDRLGLRVPAILVSPWVGARVEHTVFDHTSLLKYLIEKWNLGPLGRRTDNANSVGVALNQDKPRVDTVPFIRVPYTQLMPERPDLEKEDSSKHHEALHAFAAYLAEKEDAATAALIKNLAEGANVWVRLKAEIGKAMLRMGAALTKDLARHETRRVAITTQVAFKQFPRAKSQT